MEKMGTFNHNNSIVDRKDDWAKKKAELGKENTKDEGEKIGGLSRRTFIKGAALSAAGLAIGDLFGIFDKNEDHFDDRKKETISEIAPEDKIEIEKEMQEAFEVQVEAQKKQLEIKNEDIRIIGETIEKQLRLEEKIVVDVSTKNALRERWADSYAKKAKGEVGDNEESGKNHLGLAGSLEKMQPWILAMKEEFAKEGFGKNLTETGFMAEDFVYLTIPEAHFRLDAYSHAKAKGPYQFIENTAKWLGLRVDEIIDERCDPIKAARACAKYLKGNYKEMNNDWSLAFARYNGGYARRYKGSKENKEELNYEDYLQWREDRINNYLFDKVFNKYTAQEEQSLLNIAEMHNVPVEELKQLNGIKDNQVAEGQEIKIPELVPKKYFEHEVKEGDKNLSRIAKKYKSSTEELMEFNGMKDDKIKIGQILRLPSTVDVKLVKLSSSLENLNYPEKFYAVLDAIKEEDLKKQFPPKDLKFDLVKIPEVGLERFSYIVQEGDVVFGIARYFRKKVKRINNFSLLKIIKLIESQNKIKKSVIKPGQIIQLKIQTSRAPSLKTLAEQRGVRLSKLREINPAVVNSRVSLPSGYMIRVPRS